MKKKTLLALRILETFFLCGMIFGLYKGEPGPGGTPLLGSIEFLTVGFKIHVNFAPDPAVLSTAILGYVLSFIATLFMQRDQSTWKWNLSIALSILGFISLLNDAVRLFMDYTFEFMVTMPALLVLLDWLLFKQELNLTKQASGESDKPAEEIAQS